MSNLKPDTVIVLAGGLGTRLNSITKGRPKPLTQVAGRPFLHWKMSYLVSSGFKKFVFCLGAGATEIKNYLDSAWSQTTILYSQDRFPNCGTGIATIDALRYVEDSAFVTYADNLTSVNLVSMSELSTRSGFSVMAVQRFDRTTEQIGNARYSDDCSRIRYEKNSGGPLIDHGISLLTSDFFSSFVTRAEATSLEEILEKQSQSGLLLSVTAWRGFLEIGTPQSLAEAQNQITRYYEGYGFYS